ncbi:hypothetical protein A249_02065 [Pseudomonas syringae pv. actinidiae ICMP 18804]
MRLYLDCEFTELSAAAKLISLALVGPDGREFYVEVIDTWREDDCSDFVKQIGDSTCTWTPIPRILGQ